jgi:hypothetical protein
MTNENDAPDFAEEKREQLTALFGMMIRKLIPAIAKMERRDLAEEAARRTRAAVEVLLWAPLPPPGPCVFGDDESKSSILRRIERLRAGLTRPSEPDVSAAELANRLEKQLEYTETIGPALDEITKVTTLIDQDKALRLEPLEREGRELFHEAKRRAAGHDPNSVLGYYVWQMDRARRSYETVRTRQRNGGRRRKR